MEVKTRLHDVIIIPTIHYESDIWVWNRSQTSIIQTAEMSYLREPFGNTRMDGESNEGMCIVCVVELKE